MIRDPSITHKPKAHPEQSLCFYAFLLRQEVACDPTITHRSGLIPSKAKDLLPPASLNPNPPPLHP